MVIFSWRDIDGMVSILRQALARHELDAIIGISRSGLIPAVMLSHSLGVRRFGAIDIRRTDSDEIEAAKSPPIAVGELNLDSLQGAKVALIDDIVGAGATMRLASELVAGYCASLVSATLVVNRANLGEVAPGVVVDHHACEVHDWVIFPWEGKPVPGAATGDTVRAIGGGA